MISFREWKKTKGAIGKSLDRLDHLDQVEQVALPPTPPPEPVNSSEPMPRDWLEPACACKRCGRPITFGTIVEDLVPDRWRFGVWAERQPSRRGRVIPLDLDGIPHRCEAWRN